MRGTLHTLARFTYVIIILASFVTVIMRYAEPLTDGDLWFHLAYGRYFVENLTLIPDHSIFSWTPGDTPWIYCAWIPELVLYFIYEIGGMSGLMAMRYLIIALFMLMVFLLYRTLQNDRDLMPAVVLILVSGLLMAKAGLRLKADIFSFFFMSIVSWLWFSFKSRQPRDMRILYAFPVLFLLWVNSHVGFIFGFIFLALVFTGEIITFLAGSAERLDRRSIKTLFLVNVLSGLTVFITPYGWRYPAQILDQQVFKSAEFHSFISVLMEFQSIFYTDAAPLHFIDYLVVSAGIFAVIFILGARGRGTDWGVLFLNAFFAVLYVKYLRLTYYLVIVFVFSSIYLMNGVSLPDGSFLKRKRGNLAINGAAALLMIFFAARAQMEVLYSPGIGLNVLHQPPVHEAEYIKTTFPGLRVGNDYESGTYLLWSLWPDNKILIDARQGPYGSLNHEHGKFEDARDRGIRDSFVRKYSCDLWIVTYNTDLPYYFLKSPDWRLVYYGSAACVFLSRHIDHPGVHGVSDAIGTLNFYQSLPVAHFAYSAGDLKVAKKLFLGLKPFPFSVDQRKIALEEMVGLGDALYIRKHYNDAAEIFSHAIGLSPGRSALFVKLGNAQCRAGMFEEAVKSFKSALSLTPGLGAAHDGLANTYLLTHRPDDAIRHYKEALRIDPGNVAAVNNLALANQQKQAAVQIARLKKQLEEHPADPRHIDALAHGYGTIGDYENALTYFKQLVSLQPERPDIYYNIACIYARMDRVDESLDWLQQAIKKGFSDRRMMVLDKDLDNVRTSPGFMEMMKSVR
ncbi:MAG TPA: tetratricopeptide repeat protein [Deltaproteobacteria bacterium]|nr:tetratricopeptide repeat protein [Deltaproteobacteria bacterium]